MKSKIFTAVLALSCIFTLAACSSNESNKIEESSVDNESSVSSEAEDSEILEKDVDEESIDEEDTDEESIISLGDVITPEKVTSEDISKEDVSNNETVYSDFEYTFDSDTEGIAITKYNGSEQVVVIPETIDGTNVTVIDENAFAENIYINSVTIPKTVYAIKTKAFYKCENLQDVTFESNSQLHSIFTDSFSRTAITEFTVPESCVSVSDAFVVCKNLEKFYVLGKETKFGSEFALTTYTTVYAYSDSQAAIQLSPLHGYTFVALDEVSE